MCGDPNLVAVRSGVASRGGAHPKEYLLCKPCEDWIARWDDYLATVSLQSNGTSFPARDRSPAIEELTDDEIAVADASALDVPTITRFALSVVWRASVSTVLPKVSLGSYAEHARVFLRDDHAPPPEWMRLLLMLVTKPGRLPVAEMIVLPHSRRLDVCHVHRFSFFGLAFCVFVGRIGEEEMVEACFARKRRVILSNGDEIAAGIARMWPTLRKTPGLVRWQQNQKRR